MIGYENNWRADEWVSPSIVRHMGDAFDPTTFSPQVGDRVDAKAKSNEDEPYSWWNAEVMTVRGEFYLIKYSDWDEGYNEIVEIELLRPQNRHVHLDTYELVSKTVPVPKDLWEKDEDDNEKLAKLAQYSEILSLSNALSVSEIDGGRAVAILGDAKTTTLAEKLVKMHFKQEKQLRDIHRQHRRTADELEQEKKRLQMSHVEEFPVAAELVGLVIGKKGSNIKKAESIEGVTSVKVDAENAKVKIVAATPEAAAQARALLEFVEAAFPVPNHLVSRFVGSKFTTVRGFEKDSGVQRIRVPPSKNSKDDEEKKENGERGRRGRRPSWGDDLDVFVQVLGTKEAVEAALTLMRSHLKFLLNVRDVEKETRKTQSELRNLTDSYGRGKGNRGNGGGKKKGGKGDGKAPSQNQNQNENKNKKKDNKKKEKGGDNNNGVPAASNGADGAAHGAEKAKKKRNRKNRKPKGDVKVDANGVAAEAAPASSE